MATTASSHAVVLIVIFSSLFPPKAIEAGTARVFGDPHFVGWDGVNFDFTGKPGSTYCMISDPKIQINMHLEGRVDFDVPEGQNVTRTWITSLGLLFGYHRIALFARRGADLSHSTSFLERIHADGETLYMPLGSTYIAPNGEYVISYDSSDEDGLSPYDTYTVTCRNLAKMRLTIRPELPDLRLASDAFVHFAVEIIQAGLSPSVHGVLGQTHMNALGRSNNGSYKTKWNNLLLVQQVDSPNGEGYLDGTVQDYEVSDLLHSDCRFSRFDVNPDSEPSEPRVEVSSGYVRKYFRGHGEFS